MCIELKRRHQAGMGSVEMALVAPILAMFMVLMFQSLKASYVMQQRIVEARNAAWMAELYHDGQGAGADFGQAEDVFPMIQQGLSGGLSGFDPTDPASLLDGIGEIVNVHDKNVFSFYSQESSASFSEDYLTFSRAGLTEAPFRSWTGNLDSNHFTVTKGAAVSRTVPILEMGIYSENNHFADFAQGWENSDDGMQSGYNPKLEPKLDPKKLYPDAFP